MVQLPMEFRAVGICTGGAVAFLSAKALRDKARDCGSAPPFFFFFLPRDDLSRAECRSVTVRRKTLPRNAFLRLKAVCYRNRGPLFGKHRLLIQPKSLFSVFFFPETSILTGGRV